MGKDHDTIPAIVGSGNDRGEKWKGNTTIPILSGHQKPMVPEVFVSVGFLGVGVKSRFLERDSKGGGRQGMAVNSGAKNKGTV